MTKIVRTVKYVRGPIGKVIKWLFIAFNLLMLFWMFSYWGDVAPMIDAGSGAQQAGAAIGSTIGTGMILMFWVLGTIVLGIPVLLTKGRRVEIEETPISNATQIVSSQQDTIIISETAAKKHENLKNKNWQSKLKSISKTSLQYLIFTFFLLLGIGLLFKSPLSGLSFIIAGALLLPQVQTRLINTPLKNPTILGIVIVCLVVFSISVDKNDSPDALHTQANQQDLREDAVKDFAKNPDKVLQEISTYVENKNWLMVKTKTELLLDSGNVDIKKLYDEAVAELTKEEEEKQKQQQERLTSEFKEKRTDLISELKKEIAHENYANAERIGTEYLAVSDKEFKNLHDTAVEKQKIVAKRQALEAAAAPWSYSQNDDPMSKGKTYYASVSSSNTVQFDFPYSGTQNGRLTLRTDPRYGKDVIFSIEKGQILCPSYDGCSVLVRFDEENPASYSASGAADNSTETIFIRNYSRFVEKMMKAKRVRISVNIYQEGSPVFDFDVSGFNKDKYKPKN